MDPQTLWIIALSIATPVAGVVGFAIQVREVKKGRLENEKLQLEIEALRAKAVASDRRIVQATPEEVRRLTPRGDILFSRRSVEEARVEEVVPPYEPKASLKGIVITGMMILSLLLLVTYFLYDIYRLVAWLSTKL